MGRRTGDTGHEGDEGQAFADDLEQGTMYRQEVLDDVIAPPNNVQTPPRCCATAARPAPVAD